MKTRIISGIVMGITAAAVLAVGFLVNPIVITIAISVLCAVAAYELLYNAAEIESKAAVIGGIVYSFSGAFTVLYIPELPRFLNISEASKLSLIMGSSFTSLFFLSVIYFVYAVITVLKNHKEMNLGKISTLTALPLALVGGFGCLGSVINAEHGLYYLLLLLNFSSICDMGAYFTGVTVGKHKLCPEISPKKTVEGAIGGIVWAVIFAAVIVFAFKMQAKLIPTALCTIPLCVLGMLGDLFASAIKRSVGLKDYGNLIPGHGGILDRLDSMLLISPVLYMLMVLGVL